MSGDKNLDKYKIKLQKLSTMITDLENKYNNVWVPAPDYEKETKKCAIEKMSYSNCDFKMKIQLKKLDNKRENISFIIFLLINEFKSLNKEININYEENFYEEWIWTLHYNEWKNVDNNDENFILGINNHKNFLAQSDLNKNSRFDICKIVNNKIVSFNIPIPTLNNGQITFSITITPILPIGQKFITYELKDVINVKRIFPAFNGKSQYTNKSTIN